MSDNNDMLMDILYSECKKYGILSGTDGVFNYLHTYEEKNQTRQLSIF